MCRHRVLDLTRTDVLAAAHDEIGGSTGDGEVSLGVDLADIAHPHPAVGGVELVMVDPAEVAEAGGRATTGRLSTPGRGHVVVAVEKPHCHLRHQAPCGAQPAIAAILQRRATQQSGFIGSVELQDGGAGEVLEVGGPLVGQRLTAGEDHAQRAQVVLAGRRIGHDHHQLGTDTAQHADPMVRDRLTCRLGVELFEKNSGGTQVDRCGVSGPDTEAERSRDDGQQDVI